MFFGSTNTKILIYCSVQRILKRVGIIVSIEEKHWCLKSEKEVLKDLNADVKGLSEKDVLERINRFGKNVIAHENKQSLIKLLLKNFNSILIYILLASGLISFLSNHLVEFFVILIIILFTGLIGFFQELKAGKAIDALSKFTAKKVLVLRDGKKHEILAENLVPGDFVFLHRGMVVPADLRVLESKGLMTDESILTGEVQQKPKYSEKLSKQDIIISDMDNMLFSGTSIVAGSGAGIVVETGLNSEIGKISESLKKIGNQKSPLQKKIDLMSKRISYTVLIVGILFFIFLMSQKYELYEALLLLGAVAVSGIPESFPLALTMALSNGVKVMSSKNALIKDLSSVETLGTTTVICTDKTGTLTENKMLVVKLFSDNEELGVEGVGYEPKSVFASNHKVVSFDKLKSHEIFFKTALLCNNSELEFNEGEWVLNGEPTEGALLVMAKSAGYDEVVLKDQNKRVFEIPFDPAIKFMLTVCEQKIKRKIVYSAYLKGALEKVLDKCSFIRKNGKLVKLSNSEKEKIRVRAEKYSLETLRVLALASKVLKKKPSSSKVEQKELMKGFVFEGFVGIEDPIRKDVFGAVNECYSAGVRVVMITGDHRATARSIGERLGIVKSDSDLVLEGLELDKMDDSDLDKIIGSVAIFARTTPDHKLRIVDALQRRGEIVAMTGDGVNDSPALKKADIGVSMGKGGTDVAREASNMILADDNFSTIVNAVREGRTIYSNIRRFIYYLLTGNITEVSLVVISILAGLLSPLTALMVLFINVVTSTFPAVALSVEPTHSKVMKQKPRDPKERLLSNYVLFKILVLIPIIFGGTFLLFLWELHMAGAGIERARTVAFATLILFELFHAFNARSLHTSIFNKNFFANKRIFYATGTSLALLLLSIYLPFGQIIFKTVPLVVQDWLVIILVSSLVVFISEIIKLLIRSEFEEQSRLQGASPKLE